MKLKIFFIFIFLLIIPASMAASADDGVSVRASIDKNTILIGDRIRYVIEVGSKSDIDIVFPVFPDYRIGEFEIKDSGSRVEKHLFANSTITKWYHITTYSVGRRIVPAVEVRYKRKGEGDWTVKKTEEIPVAVESLLAKEPNAKDVRDIKGRILPFSINWIVLSILAAALFSLFIFIAYKRTKRAAPVRLPHETALEELEAVRGHFSRNGNVKEYYIGVSDCIRRYIERVFKLKAPEMTTEEFLSSLKTSSALSLEQKDLLRGFLSACDLVKFAKYKPLGSEVESMFTTAKRFVEETRDAHI